MRSDLSNEHFSERELRLRVVVSTLLWTAGYVFTSGGFLTYFAAEEGGGGVGMAFFLATPELAGTFAVATRALALRLGDRKRTWVWCSILARVAAIGIPASLWGVREQQPLAMLVGCLVGSLAVSSLFQAMSQVAWLSWMSDVSERQKWGRLLAVRNIAGLVVMLVVPAGAGYLRDYWKGGVARGEFSSGVLFWGYVTCFCVGQVFMLASILPMLKVPHVPAAPAVALVSSRKKLSATFLDPVYRRVILFQWWHAFWSGVTQLAFFEYRYQVLKIGLGTFALMEAGMRLLQIPVNRWSGRTVEQWGIRPVMSLGVVTVSSALLFWIVADSQEWWWLWGAYALWGGWGCVNVAGPLLTLKHAPSGDNTMQISVAERGAGMLAGIAGLIGGFLLTRLKGQVWFGIEARNSLTDCCSVFLWQEGSVVSSGCGEFPGNRCRRIQLVPFPPRTVNGFPTLRLDSVEVNRTVREQFLERSPVGGLGIEPAQQNFSL
ncbi:MAG: MFS transporter [Planctomycetales bacterium]